VKRESEPAAVAEVLRRAVDDPDDVNTLVGTDDDDVISALLEAPTVAEERADVVEGEEEAVGEAAAAAETAEWGVEGALGVALDC
jgi:hypothetical protein